MGVYTNFLTRIENEMKMLDKLKIKYPANAKPILYIYVVPDDNFTFLLQMPTLFSKDKKSGGAGSKELSIRMNRLCREDGTE